MAWTLIVMSPWPVMKTMGIWCGVLDRARLGGAGVGRAALSLVIQRRHKRILA